MSRFVSCSMFSQMFVICFPSSLRKQFILGKLFSSKSRKLYQQNTSVVLVSAHLSAVAQISPDIDQFRSWITGVLAFLKKSQRNWTSAVLGCLLCPGGLDLTCVFESWPNTSCYGTSDWSNKTAPPIRVSSTWVLGRLFKPPRQAQATQAS